MQLHFKEYLITLTTRCYDDYVSVLAVRDNTKTSQVQVGKGSRSQIWVPTKVSTKISILVLYRASLV